MMLRHMPIGSALMLGTFDDFMTGEDLERQRGKA